MNKYSYFCNLLNKPCCEVENCKFNKICDKCDYCECLDEYYDIEDDVIVMVPKNFFKNELYKQKVKKMK